MPGASKWHCIEDNEVEVEVEGDGLKTGAGAGAGVVSCILLQVWFVGQGPCPC